MKKGKGIIFFVSNLFLGVLFPAAHAHAWISIATKPIEFMISVLMGFLILIGISYVLLFVSNSILGWVTAPNFVTVSYTSPDNLLVQYGWTVVRDFVNLFFILVLVIIGIATALRLREYEVKKTLPRLILVILLINFTPLLCGLLIDASNILMNFFFTAGAAGMSKMINFVQASGNILANSAKSLLFNPLNLINGVFLFQMLFVIMFNFIASFVLLLFSGLFLMRHVALWILIILSPLAFFCYILPSTRSIWNKWWNQFIQWCFVGVGGAFFLYLAQVIANRPQQIYVQPGASGFGMDAAITNLLTYSVPLILLLIGLFTTMSTSAMGANMVVGMVRKGGRWTAKASSGYMKKRVATAGKKALDGMVSPQAKQRLERMASRTYSFGEGEKGIRGWTKRVGARVATTTTRGMGRGIMTATGGLLTGSKDERMSNKAYGEAMRRTSEENIRGLQQSSTRAERAGVLRAMSETKQLPDAIENGRINMREIFEAYRTATTLKDKKATDELNTTLIGNKEALKKFSTIIDASTTNLSEEKRTSDGLTQKDRALGIETFQEKIIHGIRKESDLEKIKPNSELMGTMAKMSFKNLTDGHQLGAYMRTYGDQFIEPFNAEMANKDINDFIGLDETTGKPKPQWLLKAIESNPALAGLISVPKSGISARKSAEIHKKAYGLAQPPVTNLENVSERLAEINNVANEAGSPEEKNAYRSAMHGIEAQAKRIIAQTEDLNELERVHQLISKQMLEKRKNPIHSTLQGLNIDLMEKIKERSQRKITGEVGMELLKRGIPIGPPEENENKK